MKNQHGIERNDILLGTKAKVAGVPYFREVVSVNGHFFTVRIDGENVKQVKFEDIEMLHVSRPINQMTGKEQRFANAECTVHDARA